MSIFPDRSFENENFKKLLEEADFILIVDLDFVNKSLQNFLETKQKESLNKKEPIKRNEVFDITNFKVKLNNDNHLFWDQLFQKVKFPKRSRIFIEFIPDYDCENYLRGNIDSAEDYEPQFIDDLIRKPSPEYYNIDFPFLPNCITTKNGMKFFFNKLEKSTFLCFDNGNLRSAEEPWYCCDLSHLKISLENNAYLVSDKSLLDFCVLFQNTKNEFHLESESENTSKIKWINYNLIDFENEKFSNDVIKKEIKNLFDKKRLSNLESVFELFFKGQPKVSLPDSEFDI